MHDEQILDDLTRHLLGKIGRNIDDFIKLCRIAELSPAEVIPRLVLTLIRLTASLAVNEFIEVNEASLVRVLQKELRRAHKEMVEMAEGED